MLVMENLQIPLLTVFSMLLVMTTAVRAHTPPSGGNPEHTVRLLLGSKRTIYSPSATILQGTKVCQRVAPSLDSVNKDSVRPSSLANPANSVRYLQGSLERVPLPSSRPNPSAYNPSPPAPRRRGHTVAASLDSMKNSSVSSSSSADPGQGGSLQRIPVPPSEPNPRTYIPGPHSLKRDGHTAAPSFDEMKDATIRPSPQANLGHRVRHLLGSPKRVPLPPSRPNPSTYIPSPPAPKPRGHTVAAPSDSTKDSSIRPSSSADPGHRASLQRIPVPPSEPNPLTYIPSPPSLKRDGRTAAPSFDKMKDATARPSPQANLGHRVRHLLGSPERVPLPPPGPNPSTYIPSPSAPKPRGHTVAAPSDSMKDSSIRPSSSADPGHRASLQRIPVPPSEPNPCTYIPDPHSLKRDGHTAAPSFDEMKDAKIRPSPQANLGHRVRHLLVYLERTHVPPSAPNPRTYIPGPPSPKRDGHSAASSFDTIKDATHQPIRSPRQAYASLAGEDSSSSIGINPRTYSTGRPVPKPSGYTVAPQWHCLQVQQQ